MGRLSCSQSSGGASTLSHQRQAFEAFLSILQLAPLQALRTGFSSIDHSSPLAVRLSQGVCFSVCPSPDVGPFELKLTKSEVPNSHRGLVIAKALLELNPGLASEVRCRFCRPWVPFFSNATSLSLVACLLIQLASQAMTSISKLEISAHKFVSCKSFR